MMWLLFIKNTVQFLTMCTQVLNYGTNKNKFGEMQAALRRHFLKVLLKIEMVNSPKTGCLPLQLHLMHTYLGKVPETFTWKGKEYTPLTFANEVVGIKC
jgi:bleomycin hydrolase